MRCAHTEVRLFNVQLSCICLWTNGKDNKQDTMLVYNVHEMYILSNVKTERTYTPAQLQTLVKSCQLSSSLSCCRSFYSQYPRSCHHQPCPNISWSAQMCDTNLCRTSCQYQSSTRSPLCEEVFKIGFACFSDCSFVFIM